MTTTTDADADALLTVGDVARKLRVTVRTVRAWIAGGKLAALHLGRRCLRVEPRELARFLESMKSDK